MGGGSFPYRIVVCGRVGIRRLRRAAWRYGRDCWAGTGAPLTSNLGWAPHHTAPHRTDLSLSHLTPSLSLFIVIIFTAGAFWEYNGQKGAADENHAKPSTLRGCAALYPGWPGPPPGCPPPGRPPPGGPPVCSAGPVTFFGSGFPLKNSFGGPRIVTCLCWLGPGPGPGQSLLR